MKTLSLWIATLGLVAAPYIGIAALHPHSTHKPPMTHESCIASLAAKTPCPPINNVVDYVAFHLNAAKGFFTATPHTLNFFLFVVLVAISGASLLVVGTKRTKLVLTRYHLPHFERLLDWLALQYQRTASAARI